MRTIVSETPTLASGRAGTGIDPLPVLSISPRRVALALLLLLGVVLLLHGFVLIMNYGFGHDLMLGFAPIFNLGNEHSVPTLFATLLLLLDALLFLTLFRIGEPSRYHAFVWLLLAGAFVFVALDEYAVFHERLINPLREGLDVGGYLYFAWIIPYAIGVALLGLLVGPALWRLGWRYRFLFGAAAVLYVGGAIGVEMLGGRYYEAREEQVDLTYRLFQTVEETLEYLGTILLAYTLLELISSRADSIRLRFL